MQVAQRNIGLNFNTQGEAIVRLWAPFANEVALRKDSSAELIILNKEMHGYWSCITKEIKPGDKYWFLLDGEKKLPDPASLSQPDGVHGATQALGLSYDWKDASWKNPALQDYIIYELHTGTFSATGDFSGIESHLDHLKDLGITTVELLPVAAFPGTRNWGYDGVFPFSVQHSYGGALGLQHLVQACHSKGLAIILDVVYNHVGPEGNYLGEFGSYFTDKYHTPWGNAINYDDKDCDGVRDFVIENALMWFRDFHIDALRLDAVHAIKDLGAVHILQEIRSKTDELMAQTGRKHYLIAESDLNDPRYISPVAENGLGMDAQWVDEFHHALRVSGGEKPVGYYSDFSGIEHLAKSFQDAYVYTGQYSAERKKNFGRKANNHPGHQFIVFSQNHDQVGNRMLGERTSRLLSYEMQKLMAAAVLSAPFLPMLFMGEEWGEINPFLYFVSHTDPELIEMVRKGRKAEFAAMHVDGEAPDPQSEGTFEASRLNWSLLSVPAHQTLFKYYKHLIYLRKNEPALAGADRSLIKVHVFKKQNCLMVEHGIINSRTLLLCIMNFSSEIQNLTIPLNMKLIKVCIDSASPEWLGPVDAPALHPDAKKITIQQESFIAYSASHD